MKILKGDDTLIVTYMLGKELRKDTIRDALFRFMPNGDLYIRRVIGDDFQEWLYKSTSLIRISSKRRCDDILAFESMTYMEGEVNEKS